MMSRKRMLVGITTEIFRKGCVHTLGFLIQFEPVIKFQIKRTKPIEPPVRFGSLLLGNQHRIGRFVNKRRHSFPHVLCN